MVDFVVHSPARVCLYGDHQDYLGLPVIAATINRFLHLSVSKIEAHHIDFQLLDLDASLRIPFDPSNVYETKDSIDFFRAGLRVAARHGYDVKHGLNVSITSDIPINAGVSSSSA
ncbi:MAG: galactokinase family protein, partial [Flavobacteriaceae bacterium]